MNLLYVVINSKVHSDIGRLLLLAEASKACQVHLPRAQKYVEVFQKVCKNAPKRLVVNSEMM